MAAERSTGQRADASTRASAAAQRHDSVPDVCISAAASDLGWWEVDLQTGQVTLSASLAGILGRPLRPIAIPGALLYATIHPDDRAPLLQAVRRALEHDQPLVVDARLHPPTGALRWLTARGAVTDRSADGVALRLAGLSWESTAQQTAEVALRRSEAALAEAQRLAHIGSWEWDIQADQVTWSHELYRIFDLVPGASPLSYATYLTYVHPDDRDRVEATVQHAVASGQPFCSDWRIVQPGGRERIVENRGRTVSDAAGHAIRMHGTTQDITERKQADITQEAERVLLHAILNAVEDGIVACDATGQLTLFNRATQQFHGLPVAPIPFEQWPRYYGLYGLYHLDGTTPMRPEEVPLHRALHEGVVRELGMTIVPKQGPARTVLCSGQSLHDVSGRLLGAMVRMHDVTRQRALEADLRHQAFHDPLTGLPNRILLLDRLGHALARMRTRAGYLAVLFMDVDRFKLINDGLGHARGDELLRATANRLQEAVHDGDTLARFGGDEFVYVLEDLSDHDLASATAAMTAARITERFQAPFTLAGREVALTMCIGITVSTDPSATPDDLLREADQAMYAAKQAGRGRTAFFHPSMHLQALERLALERDLHQAITRNELELAYQPVVDLASGAIRSVEALIRWRHPTQGLLRPAAFIPIAEESDLILAIGQWVLATACHQAVVWNRARGGTPSAELAVAVNLSPRQVEQPGFAELVADTLSRTGLPPQQLTLEITERVAFAHDQRTNHALETLKAHGVRLAIDDFGTGYSGLSLLKTVPVDIVKLDRSFVTGLGDDPRDMAIVQAILVLADTLGLTTIAEGIETDVHVRLLRELGCQQGQGYFFGVPGPVADCFWSDVDLTSGPADETGARGHS